MEDGDGEDRPPFWLQNATHLRRGDRLRRGVSSVLFSSGLVVLLLLVTAVFFLVFVVPSTLSFSAHIFKPNSVKKSWDSLNVVLVIFAVVFGFLSRNKNEERDSYFDGFQSSPVKENGSQKSFDFERNVEQKYESEQKNLMLKRNSSSYPDLREFSSVNWSYGDYQARFYDDINVDSGRVSDQGLIHHHRRHRSLEQVDYLRERRENRNVVVVDTLVRESKKASNPRSSPPQSAAPPAEDEEIPKNAVARKDRSSRKINKELLSLSYVAASKPPLPPVGESPAPESQENQKRAHERVARRKERSNRKQIKDVEAIDTVTAPPPPAPPPPPSKEKISKSDRKRGGATGSSTKEFLNSLYHKKKKKQRQKSVDNMESLLHQAEAPLSLQIPPPPPPPPPPSVFQNLFSTKKQKRKRTITVTLEPLPPQRAEARDPEPTPRPPEVTAGKPPQPIKMNSFDKVEEASNSGGESPLNRIPPAPPPPPPAFFRSPAWKFVVQGDYVRINSNNSSRSGSPDPDDTESDVTPSAAVAFHPSPLFCASPDVNTKAESFITNFRAKLKLEKIHSMKKREPGLSSLGPGPGPGPSQI